MSPASVVRSTGAPPRLPGRSSSVRRTPTRSIRWWLPGKTLPRPPGAPRPVGSGEVTMTNQPATGHPSRGALALFIGLMVLVGLNLRPALSSLAPVLTCIQQDTGLSALSIGALTTLPVLCLGLFAPMAPWLARRSEEHTSELQSRPHLVCR